jgi:hypothetical protein
MSVNSIPARGRMHAATLRIAASSVAPAWETVLGSDLSLTPTQSPWRSLRPCAACVSWSAATICSGGDR